MIKQQNNSNSESYLITPSLLNAWQYIWLCVENVKEAESDTISLEDKISNKQKEALETFLKTLKREPTETNQYMQAGIDFEEECYEGTTCVSPIIEGGAFQIVGRKNIKVDNTNFLMYGRLDVLKGGVIYDIKKVIKYAPGKYVHSYQHDFYLELFPRAKYFTYLAFDGVNLHTETYYRKEKEPIHAVISNFMNWLKENDLWQTYIEKWRTK